MIQLDMFPVEASLTRIDAQRNMRRFYHLRIEKTLFGEWCLIRQWGRIGTYGQDKRQWFEDIAEAIASLQQHVARKIKRGYSPE